MNNTPFIKDFGSIGDSSLGYITVAEIEQNIPFDIKRVYWTYYTPNEVQRGGHAHKDLQQYIFAVSGEIQISTIDSTGNEETFILNKPNMGLFLPPKTWRDIQFSHSAVLLCLASEVYQESDYIRNKSEFLTCL